MNVETTVLIIGGSLNGLTMAAALAYHAVPCIVIERHDSTTVQYKFAGISPRSMEIFRQLGLESEIRSRRTGDQKNGQIARGRNLADPAVQLHGMAWPDTSDLSGTSAETCDQDRLEPILRQRAEALGATCLFRHELLSLEQDHASITAHVRERSTGGMVVLRAAYGIAADGVNGTTRSMMGIERHGPGVLQDWMSILFETDLDDRVRGERFTSFFATDINGTLTPRGRRWLMALPYAPADGERPVDFDGAHVCELVRRGAGRDDARADLYNARAWQVAAWIAARFQEKRVFLIGDAAHAMPPTGAFGGNTGIQDAHNLAWKLAVVTRGQAGPRLLDTYDAERRPVAIATLGQAIARLKAWFRDPSMHLPQTDPLVPDEHVFFGHRYTEGALVDEVDRDDAQDDAPFDDPRRPSGRPGTRAPHLPIETTRGPVAVHDLFGRDLVLLVGRDGTRWTRATGDIATSRGLPLRARVAGAPFERLYGVGPDGAVLVRPDGFIAWRTRHAVDRPVDTLRACVAALTFEEPSSDSPRDDAGRVPVASRG